MLLSHKVIKRVGSEMEDWPVHPRICFAHEEEEEYLAEEDLVKDAGDIIQSARIEAEKMLADTTNRVLVIEQEAYDRGFEKGKQDAELIMKKAQEEFFKSTSIVLQQVEETREKIYSDTKKELLDLAINIAEKIVHRQLDLEPDTIADIAAAACSYARECRQVRIYVHPELVEILDAKQNEISAQLYGTTRLQIIPDQRIRNGGCRVETEKGDIDATVVTMLERLDKGIRD